MTITTGQQAATLRYGTPAEAGMDPERVDRIRERGEAWLAEGFTPSLVLLAARGGVIFLHEAFGTVGEGGAPAGRDTIYPLASISKPIAATAVMMLVEHGRIGLGRAVHDYIPEFEGKGKDDVLVWHLLTHTSGLREQDVAFYASTTGLTVTFHEEALLAGRPAQGSFIACSCPFPHELPFPCG
jgi:serine-type D-Ala-D-Ala carboxypeptidase